MQYNMFLNNYEQYPVEEEPLYVIRKQSDRLKCLKKFPGNVAYAVKSNPHKEILSRIAQYTNHWDVASEKEIEYILNLSGKQHIHYMNPIKTVRSIKKYFQHIESYSVDSLNEINKISSILPNDKILRKNIILYIRMSVSSKGALLGLENKFGVDISELDIIIPHILSNGFVPGITFHIGSQNVNSESFIDTAKLINEIFTKYDFIKHIDIGGGFPAPYIGNEPDFEKYIPNFVNYLNKKDCVLQCEPGRFVSYDFANVLVKIEHIKNNKIYINDGVFGLLSELKCIPGVHPVQLIRNNKAVNDAKKHYSFYGPTCDSADYMPGPYYLPEAQIGDVIDIAYMGAYAYGLNTQFNGFGSFVEIKEI